MKCLRREAASEMRNTYVSIDEIQWLFMGVFNYYILQLRSNMLPLPLTKRHISHWHAFQSNVSKSG